jgi:hypothetical protein
MYSVAKPTIFPAFSFQEGHIFPLPVPSATLRFGERGMRQTVGQVYSDRWVEGPTQLVIIHNVHMCAA